MEKKDILAHFGGDFTPFYSKYLQNVKRIGGQEFKALCPFHEEKDASFNFNSGSGQYFCHGCNKKGDVIHFYAKLNSLDKAVSIEDIIVDVSAFRAIEVESRGKLLAPFLKAESINLVYGWRGAGKTFFTLGIIDAITRRQTFGPWECEESTGCMFVDGEMTVTDNHERFDDLGFLEGRRNC